MTGMDIDKDHGLFQVGGQGPVRNTIHNVKRLYHTQMKWNLKTSLDFNVLKTVLTVGLKAIKSWKFEPEELALTRVIYLIFQVKKTNTSWQSQVTYLIIKHLNKSK